MSLSVESKLFIYDLTPPEAGIDENPQPDPTGLYFTTWTRAAIFQNSMVQGFRIWVIFNDTKQIFTNMT